MSETTITTLSSAKISKRLAAMLYDSLLLMAVSIGYGAAALAIKVNVFGETLLEGEKASLGPIGFIGWVIVLVAFYCVFWKKFGQTLGMKAWRLKVTDIHGKHLSVSQGLRRCAWASLSIATLGLGYLWLLVDREQLTLHDRLSATRVWQLPKGR
ncbi:RDD family protein [Gilvimarinus sp. 1_MG-2023]|uniref:RDD family protein n=1 Tax=Gilvimarinus sp. 1_MG-2023 TaxID=3062638 RepID=UPI0026E1862F|nr:RDD family protein [Gilvimarinus sp. 1_MG-2023]MDO6746056.1 RDD family protein [Gilvimarinus sp. 1_MG-2023]